MAALLETVCTRLGEIVLDSHDRLGDATILVQREHSVEALRTLRDDLELRFNFLMDLTVVDYLGREPRFEVVYHLASIDVERHGTEPCALRRRLRVKVPIAEDACELRSVIELWPAANWMEREAWDLYGVRFGGHPDLRRILLYEEFQGHPLRKDYPKERRQPLVGPNN